MLLQPRLHVGLFVRAVVVHHHMQLQLRGETQRLGGAETSATPDADAGRDIHQSPGHPTHSAPQTGWWCRCACNRASSYRTGLSSTAAPAASDLTLEFGSFHPHTALTPCLAGSYTTPPHRSASLGISHPATA